MTYRQSSVLAASFMAIGVELADFVAERKQRNATSAHGDGVCEQDSIQGVFFLTGFETGDGGCGARDAAVACSGFVLNGTSCAKLPRYQLT